MVDHTTTGVAPVLEIEHKQTLTVSGQRVTEGLAVAVRVFYEAISSGWLRERFPGARSRGTDFMTLVVVALHARPLDGEDLKHLVALGVATPSDRGRLYARVTDLGLADEMGINRETVRRSAERLAEYGLLDIYDLPPDYRDSKGQFAGSKAYVLAGELDVLCKEVNRDGSSSTVTDRDGLSSTVEGDRDGSSGTVEDDHAGLSSTATHRDGLSSTVEGDRDGSSSTVEGHRAGSTVTVNPAHRAGLSATNSLHACLLTNNTTNTAPARQCSDLTIQELTHAVPVQPPDLDPTRAFNLALDKALAELPEELRGRAGASLYTLAAELHPAALEDPSAAWPDAGGAGWVLDAVLDAKETGPIGSLRLIRAIVDRWLDEGNPYARREPLTTYDRAVLATWEAATGGDRLGREELARLKDILAVPLSGERQALPPLIAVQQHIADAAERVPRLTVDVVGALAGGLLVPPPEGKEQAESELPGDDPSDVDRPDGDSPSGGPPSGGPLLAHVTRRYEAEIGAVTQGVTRALRELTGAYGDRALWDAAFDAVVGSNVRRLDYLRTCVVNKHADAQRQGENDGTQKIHRPAAGAAVPDGQRGRGGSKSHRRRDGGQGRSRGRGRGCGSGKPVGEWTDAEIAELRRQAAAELGEEYAGENA